MRQDDVDFLGFGAGGMVEPLRANRRRGHRREREHDRSEQKEGFPEQCHIVSNFGSTSVEMKKNVTRLSRAAGRRHPEHFYRDKRIGDQRHEPEHDAYDPT